MGLGLVPCAVRLILAAAAAMLVFEIGSRVVSLILTIAPAVNHTLGPGIERLAPGMLQILEGTVAAASDRIAFTLHLPPIRVQCFRFGLHGHDCIPWLYAHLFEVVVTVSGTPKTHTVPRIGRP